MNSTEPQSPSTVLSTTKIHPPLLAAALVLATLVLHFILPEERTVGWYQVIGLLVVAADVVQAPNDKQQLEPMLDKIEALPERLGAVETLLADAGYFSAANVEACREASLEPLIAMGRQPHHPPLGERFAKEGPAPENPTRSRPWLIG